MQIFLSILPGSPNHWHHLFLTLTHGYHHRLMIQDHQKWMMLLLKYHQKNNSSPTVWSHSPHFISSCRHLSASVQFSWSVVSDSLRPHEPQHTRPHCPSPLPRVTQTHFHWVSDTIQPSHPPYLPALNLSQHQGLFQWVSSSHHVAKVLEFQISISPSNEQPGLISFRMDWLDLLAVQGILNSLL